MATKKKTENTDIQDARDALDNGLTSDDNFALLLKALTSIEEKLEAIDWKLWEMYQMGLNSSTQPTQPIQQPQVQPQVQQPVQQPPVQQPQQDGGVLKSIFGSKK
jgi:hypothetical protein|tara:strand:- start:1338 stop:1652 length:315 start_codon:yes stop_codon:yes gene_type:complete